MVNGENLSQTDNINVLWNDSSSNSYIMEGNDPGKWKVSIDDSSYTGEIPFNSYEKFSNTKAEGYYVFE